MSWERVIQAEISPAEPFLGQLEALFASQGARWPLLRQGIAGLGGLAIRRFAEDGARIAVQVNPGRRASSQARVDPGAIASRPCFLCPEHMPPEERGLALGSLVILPNPCPILPFHCTVAERQHAPQRLAGRLGALLALARAAGPELLAFYNGPGCGASAPDHAHFQLVEAAGVPLLAHLPAPAPRPQGLESFGRRFLAGGSDSLAGAEGQIERVLVALGAVAPAEPEPMLNVLVRFREGRFRWVVFPRRAHRPACFSGPEETRLAVSPAALEMAGLLVVSDPGDLARLTPEVARDVYREVSLDGERFAALLDAMREDA